VDETSAAVAVTICEAADAEVESLRLAALNGGLAKWMAVKAQQLTEQLQKRQERASTLPAGSRT